MVTPFDSNRAVDLAAAADLADYLVTEQRNDALVINGTTGEAPTTSDAEKADLVRAVADAVDGRALVVAGVGSHRHTDPARDDDRIGGARTHRGGQGRQG
jgi:4-hydroxy-tetrahydrodipicolinate synthase